MFKCHSGGKRGQENMNPKKKGSFEIVSHEGLSVNLFSSYSVKKNYLPCSLLIVFLNGVTTMTITTILAPQVRPTDTLPGHQCKRAEVTLSI